MSDTSSRRLKEPLESIYLLVRDYGAFMRSDRAVWFLQSLQKRASVGESLALFSPSRSGPSNTGEEVEESFVEVLAFVNAKGEASVGPARFTKWSRRLLRGLPQADETTEGETSARLRQHLDSQVLATHTQIVIIAARYHVALVVEIGPGMRSTHPSGAGGMLLELVGAVIEKALRQLVAPIWLAGLELRPELLLTLVVGGAGRMRVALQGHALEVPSLEASLRAIRLRLADFIDELAEVAAHADHAPPGVEEASSSAAALLQLAVFALKQMGTGAFPVLVLVTDGVAGPPCDSSGHYEGLLALMSREDLACHVLHLTHADLNVLSPLYAPFGLPTEPDLLRFIAGATAGSYHEAQRLLQQPDPLYTLPSELTETQREWIDLAEGSPRSSANDLPQLAVQLQAAPLQLAALLRPLLPPPEEEDHTLLIEDATAVSALTAVDHPFPWEGDAPPTPLLRSVVAPAYELELPSLGLLLELRAREGFRLAELVAPPPDEEDASVRCHLQISWLPAVRIDYTLQWRPRSANSGTATVEVAVLAPPELLAAGSSSGGPKSALPARLQAFITQVQKTDRFMAHLAQQASMLMSASANEAEVLSGFWNSLSFLSAQLLHKWFRMERLELFLREDTQQYQQQQQQQQQQQGGSFALATQHLLNVAEKWASYSASQSRLYLRLLPNDSTPAFCLLRLAWETRNVVTAHINFFACPAVVRLQTMSQLRRLFTSPLIVLAPSVPSESLSSPAKAVASRRLRATKSQSVDLTAGSLAAAAGLQLGPPRIVVELLNRSLRSLLVRYTSTPTSDASDAAVPLVAQTARETSHPPLVLTNPLLQYYLQRHRWTWNVDESSHEILRDLLVRTRLAEGFVQVEGSHHSIGFFQELHLRVPRQDAPPLSVVSSVQYVILLNAAPRQLVTEAWLEPQTGEAAAVPGSLSDEALWQQIWRWIEEGDRALASGLASLDYLARRLGLVQADPGAPAPALVPLDASVFRLGSIAPGSLRTREKLAGPSGVSAHALPGLLSRTLAPPVCDAELEVTAEDVQSAVPEAAGLAPRFAVLAKRLDEDSALLILLPLPVVGVAQSKLFLYLLEVSRTLWSARALKPNRQLQKLLLRVESPPSPMLSSSPPHTPGTGPEEPSTRTRAFLTQLRIVQRRCFGQLVYSMLRAPASEVTVTPKNQAALVGMMREAAVLELDVTQFVQATRQWRPRGPDELAAQARFRQALQLSWRSLPSSSSENSPTCWLYAPPVGASPEDEDLPIAWHGEDNGLGFPIYSEALMLRLECQLGHTAPFTVLPLSAMPTCAVLGLTQPPARAILRLVFNVLPALPFQQQQQPHETPMSQQLQQQFQAVPVLSLPHVVTVAINTLRERMHEVFTAEVLDILRQMRPVTQYTLNQVLSLLNSLPPTSRSLRTLSLPLSFLDMKEGRKLFPIELERSPDLPLVRLGDIFFMVEPTDSPEDAVQSVPEQNPPPAPADAETEALPLALRGTYSIPHWLLVTYQAQEDSVTALYYGYAVPGESADRERERDAGAQRIFARVRQALVGICERVNQLTLLAQLHETHLAADNLIPPDDLLPPAAAAAAPQLAVERSLASSGSLRASQVSATEDEEALMARQRTVQQQPGYYACPVVHTLNFPISRRLTAQVALRGVLSTALHPFLVANRRNTAVYRESSGNIYYLRLSETGEAPAPMQLQVQIHGLSPPSAEITQQLAAVIEARLASITVSLLSSLLLRNPLLRLTAEDIEFLRPEGHAPHRVLHILLPAIMRRASAPFFLQLLRQNLLLFMQPLHREQAEPPELPCTMTLLYNFLQEGPSPGASIYTTIGQGIILLVVHVEGLEGGSEPTPEELDPAAWQQACWRPLERADDPPSSDLPHITLELWARGTVHPDAACEILAQRVAQAVCDYALERVCFAPLPQLPLPLPSTRRVMRCALALASPSVQRSKTPAPLPSHEVPSFLAELQAQIHEIAPRLQPRLFFTRHYPHGRYEEFSISAGGVAPAELRDDLFFHRGDLCFVVLASDSQPSAGPPDRVGRGTVLLGFLHHRKVTFFLYQAPAALQEAFHAGLSRLVHWKGLRAHLLGSILMQKAGLFHHLPPAPTVPAPLQNATVPAPAPAPALAAPVRISLETAEALLNSSPARRPVAAAAASALPAAAAPASPAPIPATPLPTPAASAASAAPALSTPAAFAKGGIFNRFRKPQPSAQPQSSSQPITAASQAPPPSQPASPAQQQQEQQQKQRKKSAVGFLEVLKGHFPLVPLQHWAPSVAGSVDSPLQLHVLHLKETAQEVGVRAKQKSTLRQLYFSLWGQKGGALALQPGPPSQTFLRSFLSTARLAHTCRVPLFVAALADEFFPLPQLGVPSEPPPTDFWFSPESAPMEQQAAWRQDWIQQCSSDYARYLESEHDCTLLSALSDTKNVLLLRTLTSGAVLLRLGFSERDFVSVELWAMRRMALGKEEAVKTGPRQLRSDIVDESRRLHDALHLQSFTYDLALRRVQLFLQTGGQQRVVDPSDYIRTLPALLRYYPSPPGFARSRLYTSTLAVRLRKADEPHLHAHGAGLAGAHAFSALDVFSYVAQHAASYRWSNLEAHGIQSAVFLNSTDPSFPQGASPGAAAAAAAAAPAAGGVEVYTYSVLAFFVPGETDVQLQVRYFVLVTSSVAAPLQASSDARDAAFIQAQQAARDRLLGMLARATTDYQRDLLWRRLGASSLPLMEHEFAQLSALAHVWPVPLTPALSLGSLAANWAGPLLMAHLLRLYSDRLAYVQREPPYRLAFYLRIHGKLALLELQQQQAGLLHVQLIARTRNELQDIDYARDEISLLVNRISAWFYKELTTFH